MEHSVKQSLLISDFTLSQVMNYLYQAQQRSIKFQSNYHYFGEIKVQTFQWCTNMDINQLFFSEMNQHMTWGLLEHISQDIIFIFINLIHLLELLILNTQLDTDSANVIYQYRLRASLCHPSEESIFSEYSLSRQDLITIQCHKNKISIKWIFLFLLSQQQQSPQLALKVVMVRI